MSTNGPKQENAVGESPASYRAAVDCRDCEHGRSHKHRRATDADEAAIEDGMEHARDCGGTVDVSLTTGRSMPITAVEPSARPQHPALAGGGD